MIRSVIVTTNFSANAMKAGLYAAPVAQKSGAMVFLLHVTELVTDSIRQPSIHCMIDCCRKSQITGLKK
jgi:hypothetical protein